MNLASILCPLSNSVTLLPLINKKLYPTVFKKFQILINFILIINTVMRDLLVFIFRFAPERMQAGSTCAALHNASLGTLTSPDASALGCVSA